LIDRRGRPPSSFPVSPTFAPAAASVHRSRRHNPDQELCACNEHRLRHSRATRSASGAGASSYVGLNLWWFARKAIGCRVTPDVGSDGPDRSSADKPRPRSAMQPYRGGSTPWTGGSALSRSGFVGWVGSSSRWNRPTTATSPGLEPIGPSASVLRADDFGEPRSDSGQNCIVPPPIQKIEQEGSVTGHRIRDRA
jgi:hypothetical protein